MAINGMQPAAVRPILDIFQVSRRSLKPSCREAIKVPLTIHVFSCARKAQAFLNASNALIRTIDHRAPFPLKRCLLHHSTTMGYSATIWVGKRATIRTASQCRGPLDFPRREKGRPPGGHSRALKQPVHRRVHLEKLSHTPTTLSEVRPCKRPSAAKVRVSR
jgi:hypothetical protein